MHTRVKDGHIRGREEDGDVYNEAMQERQPVVDRSLAQIVPRVSKVYGELLRRNI